MLFEAGELRRVMLPVSNLERSIVFYHDTLGLELIQCFDPPGLAFFRLGAVRLLLERSEAPQAGDGALYLETAGDFGPPGDEEWMAFFRDPDGNVLALASRGAGRPGA
jgi:catechol 2,3-dioxygenase-like lactoylglutathione lyase family enzyme